MISSSSSSKSSLSKFVLYPKPKPFKVMVLGQSAIGKTALVVRFITRRFIGDYDPTLEKIYSFQTVIDNETVNFEILDTAGELREGECAKLEANIRWADAFILMYSVTDKCSFDECHRLKFLINYNKRRWTLASSMRFRDERVGQIPVVLVGNKTDIAGDRMVRAADGRRRCHEIGCVAFHEISVRESIEQCWEVFRDVRRFWRVTNKWKGRRGQPSGSATATGGTASGPQTAASIANPWPEDLEEEDECDSTASGAAASEEFHAVEGADTVEFRARVEGADTEMFRARSSTESRLSPRPTRPRDPRPPRLPVTRRLSVVAMRGSDSSY